MSNQPRYARHLALGTISFAMCFALWGLVGAFGPVFREQLQLSATQRGFLVVLPGLLGAMALSAVLLIVRMWLLTAALEACLPGTMKRFFQRR
jgi:nitrate/nitrite transporter NarK